MKRRTVFLLVGLLVTFSAALIIRTYPAKYGVYLNENDPYYGYRVAEFIVDNFDRYGIEGFHRYFSWTDTEVWYPEGRQVASTSQVGLHLTGAVLYLVARNVFALNTSLYDFLVFFPVVIGSLTVFAVFLLVRRIAGDAAGLFAALAIAFSPPVIVRGWLGWFKSEPLALFVSAVALYALITIYDSKLSARSVVWRSLATGFLLGYANTAWGGAMYFSIVYGLFLLCTPFIDVDKKRNLLSGSIIVATLLMLSAASPRPGPSFVANPVGTLLLASLFFTYLAYKMRSPTDLRLRVKSLFYPLFGVLLLVLVLQSFGLLSGVTQRYLSVINPAQKTLMPLVESVSEHYTATGADFFSSYFTLLFLGGFGALVALRVRTMPHVLALVIGISGIYVSASFSRLMVLSSLSLAILAGIGLAELTRTVLKSGPAAAGKMRIRLPHVRGEVKFVYTVAMIGLLSIPLAYPANASWLDTGDYPATISNGGTGYRATFPDWFEALSWIRENTPEDAVIASWWDYGYWITVMGDRNTIADPATINSTRIGRIATAFMSEEQTSRMIFEELHADYVLVFLVGQKFMDAQSQQELYILGGGGDESKKQWFIRIAGLDTSEYLYEDEFTAKPKFWESAFGKMVPLKFYQYVEVSNGEVRLAGSEYQLGRTALFTYE